MYLRYRQKLILGISFIVIASLVISSVFVYFEFFAEDEIIPEELIEFEPDDRISPLTNQGLILEIIRIRHRGLLDEILKRGTSWRNKPMFYFISNMDDLEYVSKDVQASGGGSETLFKTWDTMFQENKIMRNVEEEQETSSITLTIMERQKKGILGRRSQDFERDKIQVTYDYRTGQWSGDDYFMDEDGYGHYLGEYFEVWFNLYQMDYDGDSIPYWTEVNVLHTDPKVDDSNRDPDEDGIPTVWEWKWGYNPHIWDDHENLDPDIDGIENIEEYQMAKWCANPFSQDIYIEADGMVRGGLFDPAHVCWEESQQIAIELFSQHRINMYFDYGWPGGPTNGGGELLPHYDVISQDSGMMLQFYNNHFADERKGIFRYLVVAHSSGFCHPSEFNRYDTLSVGASLKRMVSPLGPKKAYTPRTWRISLASTIMHEIGHSLGITPWTFEGCDNRTYSQGKAAKQRFDETWGDYYSVMNYYHMHSHKLVDYSDGSNGPPYDQNDWIYLYLPTFQTEASVIEEPFFGPPGIEGIVEETIEYGLDGWNYSEEITNQFIQNNAGPSPVSPIETHWRAHVKIDDDDYLSNRSLRIYAKPHVEPTYSEWILVKEGYVDEEGNIQWELDIEG